jgi:hypothetical protein
MVNTKFHENFSFQLINVETVMSRPKNITQLTRLNIFKIK